MRNLLKEEGYKSVRGVTIYICIAASIVLFLLNWLISIDASHSWQELGINMTQYANMNDFIMVFCLVYVCGEFARGTMKNYTAVGISKGKIFLSKFIKVGVSMLILFVLNMLLSLLTFDYNSGGIGFESGLFLYMTFYNLLIILQVICVGVSLAFLIRSIGGYIGITLGIEFLYTILAGVAIFSGLMNMGMPYANVGSIPALTRFLLYLYNIVPSWTTYYLALTNVPLFEQIFIMAAPVLVSGIMISWAYLNFKRRDIK